jgi:hypothetical protein
MTQVCGGRPQLEQAVASRVWGEPFASFERAFAF